MMTELGLYKFVKDNQLEYDQTEDEVYLFVENHVIQEWNTLIGDGILDEEGLKCTMKDGYFAFDMEHICDYHGIEMDSIFKKE